MIVWAQQLRGFAVLKPQELLSGTIQDRQDLTIRLTRGVEVLRIVFGHASGFLHGSAQTGHLIQREGLFVGACEEGVWRESVFQHR
eukprot:6898699-Pyramimonas_sp.AAC.1